ncbi:MAG: cell shape determining protein MreC [Candidatus Westeberhardia cardiocondylae]|nr:cell shape determining protein MreC [Candidatus Westeberhardia cardiocondylae]
MKKNFNNKFFTKFKFIIIIIFSVTLITLDKTSNLTKIIKNYLENFIKPIYFIVNIPNKTYINIYKIIECYQKAKTKHEICNKNYLVQKYETLLLNYYKTENYQLRKLLKLPIKKQKNIIIAQILSNNSHSNKCQIIINKGEQENIYIGQPVINTQGIVGQIISTTKNTSRVLLLHDISHAIPVKILRNNTHGILVGKGLSQNLELKHIPEYHDIKIGDILISSGLGGCFPKGYPVAIITKIVKNFKYPYTIIQAKSVIHIQDLNYLILI